MDNIIKLKIPELLVQDYENGCAILLSDEVDVDQSTLLQLDIYDDQEYNKTLYGMYAEKTNTVYLGIKYLRLCKIKDLTKKEIRLLQGEKVIALFMAVHELNPYSFVPIVVFEPHSFDLNELDTILEWDLNS